MRYILIILGLLLFLGWSVPSLKWGLEVAEAQVALRDGDASQLAEVIGGPAPLRWWQRRKDFNDTVNTSFLSDERFVSIELEMPFAELLAAGEPIPDPVFREVYAAARAPSRLIRLCAEVLDTLAVTCDVAKPRARVKDDGRTTLQGNL
ncbi:MAG: hypothetical protein EP318_08355 [Rhodobacteraceae bacterium]|nr:MAG: hypothetical protein EP318_08355 [Paracoccaceae bacterium]